MPKFAPLGRGIYNAVKAFQMAGGFDAVSFTLATPTSEHLDVKVRWNRAISEDKLRKVATLQEIEYVVSRLRAAVHMWDDLKKPESQENHR